MTLQGTIVKSDIREVALCQCCLSDMNLKHMRYQYEFENCVNNYCDMLQYAFSIQIIQSFREIYICVECIDRLRTVCNFREQVEKTQESILQKVRLAKDELQSDQKFTPDDDVSNVFDVDHSRTESFEDNFIDPSGVTNTPQHADHNLANNEASEDCSRVKSDELHNLKFAEPTESIVKNKKRKRKVSLPYKLNRNNLQCAECQQMFICFKDLQNHMHSHYPNHVCHICGNFFAIAESLTNHLRRQHSAPRFKCDECGKMYRQHSALSNHITTIHRGEKLIYKCTECSEQFHTFHKRVIHMIYQHGLGNRLTYKCQECPRVYIHCSELRAHIRRDHRLERRYQCEKCDHAFFQNKLLKEHMVCHSGERNYQCEICSKSFARKDTLRCHLKTHEVCKSCFVCGQNFTLLSSLKKHEKTHDVDQKFLIGNEQSS